MLAVMSSNNLTGEVNVNIREIAHLNPNYYEICREERNYAAILFAALCVPGNAERFLTHCGFEGKQGPEFGIYFEYAYLRDLWNKITDDAVRKEIIQRNLPISGIDELLKLPTIEINRKFGVGGALSEDFVQYPGRWAIVNYNQHFPGNDDFLKVCRFKWSFNIKPAVVIHLEKNRAICIRPSMSQAKVLTQPQIKKNPSSRSVESPSSGRWSCRNT